MVDVAKAMRAMDYGNKNLGLHPPKPVAVHIQPQAFRKPMLS